MNPSRGAERFGLAGILTMMTTFGLLFGGLRLLEVDAPVYVFFGSLALSIGLAQMVFGRIPGVFAASAGALLLPAILIGQISWEGGSLNEAALGLPCVVLVGAMIGYCTGGLALGVFTLLQLAYAALRRRKPLAPPRPLGDRGTRDEPGDANSPRV